MTKQLLLGSGRNNSRRIEFGGHTGWDDLTTLDINPDHKPDIIHNLEEIPLPLESNSFDEIHAYEILEHVGRQGDYKFFLSQFEDFWRILKPEGLFYATCPSYKSMWAWGDPSHTRVLTSGSLVFLDQQQYISQVDGNKSPMSDFRGLYHADFESLWVGENDERLAFILKSHKPSRGHSGG